jgi:2-polyprenyl-6-methoxyphenol hydroxylase-like FAD-dependent oxidoreductase
VTDWSWSRIARVAAHYLKASTQLLGHAHDRAAPIDLGPVDRHVFGRRPTTNFLPPSSDQAQGLGHYLLGEPLAFVRHRSIVVQMIKNSTDVLVVGAGPTGLFLALVLAKLGIRPRVVDAAEGPGTTSRALAVQARTLEIYRQVGLATDVLDRGLVLGGFNLWRRGELAAHVDLRSAGTGLSPFPFGVIFPQDEHERLLIAHLDAEGIAIERRTTITSIEGGDGMVVAQGNGPDGAVTRAAIGVGFPGGTYEHLFYVADVTARGKAMNRELHVLLDDAGFLGIFPLAGEGRGGWWGR